MMYWGQVLVFAVLTASSFVKSAVDDFQCPVCNARGPNARDECDKKITYETCTQENPICVSTLYKFGRFLRDCSDESNYETNLENCKKYQTCRKAKCKEPKCKAEIPLVDDFQCPVCNARGPNARDECDKKITYKTCTQENPICVSTLYKFGRFLRDCSDESNYETNLENCKKYQTCRKAKCKEPKCKAEIPLVDDFQCPVCNARGPNARDECDKKITYKTCTQENPICVSTLYKFGRFLRDCSDERNYETNLENCEKSKTCRKAKCKEPKCKAEIPLECPHCVSNKSLNHCDKNIKTRTCQLLETRCFVGKVTYSATDYFIRSCMDPKTAEDTASMCTEDDLKAVCQFGTCQEPGCLASFEN